MPNLLLLLFSFGESDRSVFDLCIIYIIFSKQLTCYNWRVNKNIIFKKWK